MKCKVLHYIPGFNHGGIESRLIDWQREIDDTRFHFDIIKTTKNSRNQLLKDFKKRGGDVYTIPNFSIKNFRKFKIEMENIISQNNYDVIHCHSPTTGKFVLEIAKKYNVPLRIMHARTTQFDKNSSALLYRKYLKYRAVKHANKYLSCSLPAGEWMYGKKHDFEIINNGINVDEFKFNPKIRKSKREELGLSDTIVLGYVSRLTASKNHKLAIDIVKVMIDRGKKTTLLLIGDGPEKDEILRKIKELKLEKNVILLGEINNVAKYYQAMDIFIFPSQFEGFGTVAIESQAAGLKTIVSEGVPKAIEITNLVERISLSSDARIWADVIINNLGYLRNDTTKKIINAGFDAQQVVEKLEEIYLDSNQWR